MTNGDDSNDEFALFRRELEELSGVRPLTDDRVTPLQKRLRPVPIQRIADDRQVVRELAFADPYYSDNEVGDELSFVRPGLQRKVLRRLRRGEFSIRDMIDLHGMTVAEARIALAEFLNDCRARGVRGIRIIHGKGLSSPDGKPVIKNQLDGWLRHRDQVMAFCSARPVDGGTGALYVLLRR
jgi:DNA-nicking Smr family endonuclease